MSREKIINQILLNIAGIPEAGTGISRPGTGIAEPGDMIYSITHYPEKTLKNEPESKGLRGYIKARTTPWWKPWLGLDKGDVDDWHVAIYMMGKKRRFHSRVNLWIVHSTNKKGVHIQQITPGKFSTENTFKRTRVEILEFGGIRNEQRKRIVDFAESKVGSEFDKARWSHIMLPYVLGLPNVFHRRGQFSCQQLAIAAYAAAGIYFPHPYRSFPIFNIGRYLGHPLGHPRDRVDPRYPYLMDHHIYRDPRFVLKAAIFQDPKTREILLQTENLVKYSWDEKLRTRYMCAPI